MASSFRPGLVMVFIALSGAACTATRSTEREVGAAAAPATDREVQLVEDILRLSGMQTHVERLPEMLLGQSDALAKEADVDDYGELRDVLEKSFTEQKLHDALLTHVLRHADSRRLQRARTFLETPLGRRMATLQRSAVLGEDDDMEAWLTKMAAGELDEMRLARIDAADKAMGMTQRTVDSVFSLLRLMLAMVTEDGAALPDDFILDEERALRAQLFSHMKDETLAVLLYAWRDIPDDDLGTYTDFWMSDDGAWLSRTLRAGLVHAIRDVGLDAVEDLHTSRAAEPPTS